MSRIDLRDAQPYGCLRACITRRTRRGIDSGVGARPVFPRPRGSECMPTQPSPVNGRNDTFCTTFKNYFAVLCFARGRRYRHAPQWERSTEPRSISLPGLNRRIQLPLTQERRHRAGRAAPVARPKHRAKRSFASSHRVGSAPPWRLHTRLQHRGARKVSSLYEFAPIAYDPCAYAPIGAARRPLHARPW